MISALVIGGFAVAVERKLNPLLVGAPVVIASEHSRSKVVAMCDRVRLDGVTTANTIRQAEVLSPDLEIVPVNHSAYQRWSCLLADVLLQYSNKIEVEYQPTTTAYYVKSTDLLSEMQHAIGGTLGIVPGVGVASNKFTARVAGAYATHTRPYQITVSLGKEAEFLASYPVSILPLDKKMARRLPLLGIQTIGQYARLPKGNVLEQFGKYGRRLHDLANGIDIRPLSAYSPPEYLIEKIEVEDAIINYQIIEHIIAQIAQTLALRLQSRQAHKLTLILQLENQQILEQTVQPPDPIAGYKAIVNRSSILLYKQSLNWGVISVELQLHDLHHPKPTQLSLFDDLNHKQSLSMALPTWQQRHQSTDFLAVNMEPTPVYFIPEHQFTYKAVGA